MHRQTTGFSLVALIIAVVVLALVGFIGYKVYEVSSKNNSSSPNTTHSDSNNQQSNQTTNPNQGYLVIKEWGVRLKTVDGLEYTLESEANGVQTAYFTTTALKKFGESCAASSKAIAPLGWLTRSQNQDTSAAIGSTYSVKISGYDYVYYTAQAVCSDSSDARDLQTSSAQSFKAAIHSLEAAK